MIVIQTSCLPVCLGVFCLTCSVEPLLSLSVGDQILLLADVQFKSRGSVQNTLLVALQRGRVWGKRENLHQFLHFGGEAAAPVHALDLQTCQTESDRCPMTKPSVVVWHGRTRQYHSS